MWLVVPASTRSIARALDVALEAAPTYPAAPVDAGGDHFADDRLDGVIGRGEHAFDAAKAGLRSWATHRVAGVRAFPSAPRVNVAVTCLVAFGTPLLAIAAPCRVTDVVDEPGRFGFTYVTLAGHPEQGEETFEAHLDGDGAVHAVIAARSRPASALVRVGAPVGRLVQHRVARGYLRALERDVARRVAAR
jgi:uncharacterized protein (UPF0548 family)